MTLQDQQAEGSDGLNRLPQPHIIGQQQRLVGHQRVHAFQLVGEECPRPLQGSAFRKQQVGRGLEKIGEPFPERYLGTR